MTRADKLLIFFIGIIGLLGLGRNFYPLFIRSLTRQTLLQVEIFYQGKLFGRYQLNSDRDFFVGPALVSIYDRKVRIVRNNCPNQICVRTGAIKYPGQSIVCVPNKILITIVSPEQKIDSLTY